MNTRSRMIVLTMVSLTVITTTKLYAQSSGAPSPTVVSAQYSASSSPYTPSTTPLADVPEGVTTYYWPEITALPQVTTVSYAPTSFAPSGAMTNASPTFMPQPQTTLRPIPSTTVQYAPSGGQCVCTPVGQMANPAQTAYLPAQEGYAMPPASYLPATGYNPAYAYRPVMPVSQLKSDYYFGRGLIGQPKVYVTGQPVRNALRFISP